MAEWRKVDELFQAAVELSPDQREAFLAVACGSDDDLRRQVQELLDADGRSTDGLGAAVEAEIGSFGGADDWKGRRIGSYELVRKLGEGGMGAVYLAGRVGEFRQQVTVKLIKAGMDSDGILRRFRNERQILASLNHRNIARLIDGGTTASGQPYFVMDYIDGEPIDDYCDHHKLTIDERLELFCKICAAVHYAHQNLVVHRDLKPVNILVTEDGEPKLLDFGIAKLLNPELAGQTVTPTGFDFAQPMTVPYASPEQVRGTPVTTVTDVYSLGVLLYELLTGHRPYRFTNYSPLEVERVICDTDPDRPSTAIQRDGENADGKPLTAKTMSALRGGRLESVRRKLTGDLDNIVLMAMRKEPQRRYASAEQLAEDIRRHLEGRPVIARPATFFYRSGKFVRRNKLAVVLGTSLAASMLAFAIVMTALSLRLAEQRNSAVAERARSEVVTDFLVDLFEVSDPFALESRGNEITAREILDRGAQKLEKDLADQPQIQAKLMVAVGESFLGLGLFDAAQERLEKALEIQEKLFTGDHVDLADTLTILGAVLRSKNQLARAEELTDRALKMRRRLLGNEHIEVAETMFNLGQLQLAQRNYTDAEASFRELLPVVSDLMGADHHFVTLVMNDLAVVLHSKGDLEAAEPLYQQALERYRRRQESQAEKANVLSSYGALLQAKGDYEGAAVQFRESLDLYRNWLGTDPHPAVAHVLRNLASLSVATGDYEGALTYGREALDIYSISLPPGHPRIAQTQSHLGASFTGLGRLAEAEPLLIESYRVLSQQGGEPSLHLQTLLSYLVDFYNALNKPAEAARYQAMLPESDGG